MFKSLFPRALVVLSMYAVVSDAGVSLSIPNNPTQPLDKGSETFLLCTADNVTRPRVELLHDGAPLCGGCENISSDLTVTEDIRIAYLPLPDDSFLLFVVFDNLTESDNGEYTCRTSSSNTATFDLRVAELTCDSGVGSRLEYIVGESLELRCYNPFPRGAVWLNDEGSMLSSWTREVSPDVNLSMASVSLGLDSDFASFECSLAADSDQQALPKSCIIGPIRVLPFIEIASSIGDEMETTTDSVSLTCRVFPENNETEYRWDLDIWTEQSDEWRWSVSNISSADSTLTIYNLSLAADDVINVTCEGVFQDWNLTVGHDITVVEPLDVILIIIIVSSAAALIIVVTIMTLLCCCIMEQFQRKTLVIADRYPTTQIDSEKKGTKISGVILNRYDRDPTELAASDLAGDDRPTILTQLPDGRLQLQERKMSTDTVLSSHGSTFSDVSHRSIETSIDGDIYDAPPERVVEADSSSLQEIYDEPPTRNSIHADAVPRPVSVLLPTEHNTPSFRFAAKDRPIPFGTGSLPGRINRAFSRSTGDEDTYHDPPRSRVDSPDYEDPIYSSVNKNRTLLAIDVSEDDDIQDNQESFYDLCDEEEDEYTAIGS